MERLYTVTLGTGTAWTQSYNVYAFNEQDALDIVADQIEEQELRGLYMDWHELADICDIGETPDSYAEAHNLVCAGNHGIYVQLINITPKEESQHVYA
jgi:hypothetical protein